MRKHKMLIKFYFLQNIFLYVFLLALLFSISFFYYTPSYSQETQPSAEQIEREAAKRGISAEQLRSMDIDLSNPQQAIIKARQMGISEAQIQSALQEQQQQTAEAPDTTIVTSETSEEGTETIEEVTEYEEEDTFEIEGIERGRFYGLTYYGYDIFQKEKGTVEPVEIGPVDPGYVIGAGDILRFVLWGEVEYQYELEVNREGNIIIPKVGQVFVAGTRLESLRETLKNYLSKFYSGLRRDPPTIFMDVTIARLRSNRIFIMGEVNRPGTYSVSSYSTAFNILYAIGGPKLSGSLREVRILREGKVISRVDLYDYLLKGVSTNDRRLNHNDIVFVPPRGITIGIKGEILRPAIYELTEKETLKDLVEMAGGLSSTAYAFRAQIDRIVPFEKRKKGEVERELIDINIDAVMKGTETVPLYDGDILTVFPIIDEMVNYVDIAGGGIIRPGRYELNDKVITLSDLIVEADGLTGDANLSRADIIRTKQDLTQEFIQINLEAALRKEPDADIQLKRWDMIYIYSQREMVEIPSVSLDGFVKQPGTYLLPDNMKLYDLLFKYSGLQDSLRLARTFMDRGDIHRLGADAKTRFIIPFNVLDVWNNNSVSNISLNNGDTVIIYENSVKEYSSKTVTIDGAVKNPGEYEWKENMTLPDLILEGGGFSDGAWILDAEIARFPSEGIQGDSSAIIIKVPIMENKYMPEDPESVIPSILARTTSAANFTLEQNDHVFIRTNPDYEQSKTVIVTGEVIYPGTYALKSKDEMLSDLIARAGGLKSTAYTGGGQLIRADQRVFIDFEKVLNKKDRKEDIILLPGDEVIIPPKPNSVLVIGEVINQGFYKHITGTRAREYLRMSGGRTENGGKVYVQEPSGRLTKVTFLKNPKIRDGSIITVYLKPPEKEKEKIDWAETVKESFAIMASAMMIIYLSQQVK